MFKKQDLVILVATIILSLLGVFTLISTTIDLDGNIYLGGIVAKQIVFILIGYIFYFLAMSFDYSYLKHIQIAFSIYIISLIFLVLTLLYGPVINNVQRWLIVGGVQIQASEIAKISVIILTAAIMSQKYRYNEWLLAAVSFAFALPVAMLIYMQPHGAMAIIVLALWFLITFTFLDNQLRNGLLFGIAASMGTGLAIITLGKPLIGGSLVVISIVIFVYGFYSRIQWRSLFIAALSIGVLLGGIGAYSWNGLLHDYQRKRIEVFLNSEEVNEDDAFNVKQAQIAIGSGGILGKGFGFGSQSRLSYLPEHQTDFIFAAFGEQFGLLGGIIILIIYGVIITRILWLGMSLHGDFFGSILAIGLAMKLLIEVFINIGTNTGAIPATGIPLPLMSAGGSITIATFLTLGIVQSIIVHQSNQPKISDLVDNEDLLI
jgi:rod shape determining protein RodA